MSGAPPRTKPGAAPPEPPVAATIAASIRARALREAGYDVISLALGEPDFPTPAHIIDAAHDAALRGETKYPPIGGTAACRQAIVRKLARDNGIDARPDEIIVTSGSKQAIYEAFAATIVAGDEVIVPAPYWASYPLIAESFGAVPVAVDCPEHDDFRLDPARLADAITPRTRWLVLNFPNNPTGATCEPDRLRAVAAILRRHPGVRIMSDDIYEHLIHDGTRHATLAAIAPDLRSRTLTIGGVSKSYAMTGWRIGWATGPAGLIARMTALQGNITSGASSIGQAATVAALDGPQDQVAAMRARYAARRDLALDALTAVLPCRRPDGAFYLFPSIAPLIGRTSPQGRPLPTGAAIADALLEETYVAAVAGSAFGASSHLRLSIACDETSLTEACRRIAAFCRAVT